MTPQTKYRKPKEFGRYFRARDVIICLRGGKVASIGTTICEQARFERRGSAW
jgi:hypothetical protein